jgi:hypothetical protein
MVSEIVPFIVILINFIQLNFIRVQYML